MSPLPRRNRALGGPQAPIPTACFPLEAPQGRVFGVAVVLPGVALLDQPAIDVPPLAIDHRDQPAVLVDAPHIEADPAIDDDRLERGCGLVPVGLVPFRSVDALQAHVPPAGLDGVPSVTLVTTASIPAARPGVTVGTNTRSQRTARSAVSGSLQRV